MTFLADTFRDLANDPSWPWKSHQVGDTGKPRTYWTVKSCITGKTIAAFIHYQAESEAIAQSPLTIARLALMLVEQKSKQVCEPYASAWSDERCLEWARDIYHIQDDHYTNVKKRVEEIEG